METRHEYHPAQIHCSPLAGFIFHFCDEIVLHSEYDKTRSHIIESYMKELYQIRNNYFIGCCGSHKNDKTRNLFLLGNFYTN